MGETEAQVVCDPLPYNTTAAEQAMYQCADTTVGFTEMVLLATVAALFGATIAIFVFRIALKP